MCHKVVFYHQNHCYQIAFDQSYAKLPILLRNGQTLLMPWGRRNQTPSSLPLGGWVTLEEIYNGRWDSYFPKPIKMPIRSFLVRDIEDQVKWFHLPSDKWIQGLIAQEKAEKRVYIVTLTPNKDSIYPRWPRILLG